MYDLKEVIEDVFSYLKDRKCVRHMYTNFKEKHKGQALKDVVWKDAKPTYLQEYENVIDQLKSLLEVVYIWIKGEKTLLSGLDHTSPLRASVICSLITTVSHLTRFWPTYAGVHTYQVEVGHLINMLWTLTEDHVHAGNETSLGSHVAMLHQSFD
ncbi:hypothetical protein V6N13_110641 [Hibiscus sabdariffa]